MKKYTSYLFALILLSMACVPSATDSGTSAIRLKFNEQGKFKIVQFTDLHFVDGSPNSDKTIATINTMLDKENPDIVIITGDAAIDNPSLNVWHTLSRVFESHKTPFTVVMGNHDPETMSRDSIYDLLAMSSCFVGSKGPQTIDGVGNYAIPVYGKQGEKPQLIIYGLDSHDYLSNVKDVYYDYIHFNQIQWYRRQSRDFSRLNGGKPVPSLMFFHIPLAEIDQVAVGQQTIGHIHDEYKYPKINSGLFASFLEMGDVMGVFCGHDHENDFIGLQHGIAMAYGRVGGADAYGKLERGCRVIELNEAYPRAFTTWISTPTKDEYTYYYPSGITKLQEDTAQYMPAQDVNPTQNGVNFDYYEGTFATIADIAKATPLKSGVMEYPVLDQASVPDHFAYIFRSWLKVPQKGIYFFYTFSDDGSVLSIDDRLVVDNDGSHSEKRAFGSIALDAGFHLLQLSYFEDYMGQKLEVSWGSKYVAEEPLPKESLFVIKP